MTIEEKCERIGNMKVFEVTVQQKSTDFPLKIVLVCESFAQAAEAAVQAANKFATGSERIFMPIDITIMRILENRALIVHHNEQGELSV
jgi:hypothetical protein